MRRGAALVALVAGVAAGYTATIAFSSPPAVEPSQLPTPRFLPLMTSTTTLSSTTAPPSTLPEAGRVTYLVWSTGGLPASLVDRLTTDLEVVTIVAGNAAELDNGDGSVTPLDALAIDPTTYGLFEDSGPLADLRPGTVVLGETSARLRQATEGDVFSFSSGHDFTVAAVVPDDAVAAAEVVFHRDDPANPVITDRYALIATDIGRTELEAAIRTMYDGPAPLRIRIEGETPWLRHGDAVLPQALIKEALGEFTYTNRVGSAFDQDRAFREEWVTTADVPILGTVECHRVVVEMLVGALEQLLDEGLAHLVDPAGYAGCWSPRFTRTITGESSGLSRHSWGAAVDLNAPANPLGTAGNQDPRLVEIMQEWGFTWGGDWLVPDPMHFEYGILPAE